MRIRWSPLVLATVLCVCHAGCVRQPSTPPVKNPSPSLEKRTEFGITPIELPQGEQKPGAAVVILVDTSGSMEHLVMDKERKARPKYLIAREALDSIVQHTAQWKKANPMKQMQMGIYHFSSNVGPVLPLGEFDVAKARAAVANVPRPTGGTAIGLAMEEGFKALYKSGVARKYLICVTDGENTAGVPPDRVARQLHAQTKGEVEIHFVAFDTAARHFEFLKGVNGHVVQASDGPQLQAELTKIYDQRILVEAEDPAAK